MLRQKQADMQLYILLDVEKLEYENEKNLLEMLPDIQSDIEGFIAAEEALKAQPISVLGESVFEPDFALGFNFHIKQKKHLNKPISFANSLAEKYQQDFVIGLIENGEREAVSYFGFEEGLGDSFMIAQYIF